MKVTLYANVSANGKVLLAENQNHQLPQEIGIMGVEYINKAGNLVMGRKSFETVEQVFGGVDAMRTVFPNVELVLLSTNNTQKAGYTVVSTPEEAIEYLSGKGFSEVFVAGGTTTYNAFFERDLITNVVFNILPIITTGGILGIEENLNIKFKLVEYKRLTDAAVQLHLAK